MDFQKWVLKKSLILHSWETGKIPSFSENNKRNSTFLILSYFCFILLDIML